MAADVQLKFDVETQAAIKELAKLTKALDRTGDEAEKSGKKSSAAWSTFKGVIGAQVVLGGVKALGNAITSMGSKVLKSAIQVETMTTELATMTGSVEEAEKVLESLQDFAATTPFQLPGIAAAAKQLIAFGFEVDSIVPRLKSIGDVAAGSGSQLSEVSLIYGQVSAAGKLMGDRLLQFQERAIPIGPAIAKTMGVAEDAVRDLVSKGKVDFATFEKAFNSMSQEGGIFFNSMIDKSGTLSGLISTLGDNFDLLSAGIGKELLPFFKTLAKEMTTFIRDNKKAIVEFVKNAVIGFGKLLLAAEKFYNFINGNPIEDRIKEINKEIKKLDLVANSAARSISNYGASVVDASEQEEAKEKLKALKIELAGLREEAEKGEVEDSLIGRLK